MLLAAFGLTVLLGAVGAGLYLRGMADDIRPRLEQAASKYLRRSLRIGDLEWRFRPTLVLIGRNVVLLDSDRSVLASSPEIVIDVAVSSLPDGIFAIERMTIRRLRTHLLRGPDDRVPLAEMLKDISQGGADASPPPADVRFEFRRIELREADVRLRRASDPQAQSRMQADGFILLGGSFPFQLSGKLTRAGFEGDLSLAGALRPSLDVLARSEALPLGALQEIAPALAGWTGRLVAVEGRMGRRDASLKWELRGAAEGLRPLEASWIPEIGGTYELSSHSESRLTLAASYPWPAGPGRIRADIGIEPASGQGSRWDVRTATASWSAEDIRLDGLFPAGKWPVTLSGTASGTGAWTGDLSELSALGGSGSANIELRELSLAAKDGSTPTIPRMQAGIMWSPRQPLHIDLRAGEAWTLRASAHSLSEKSLSAEIEGRMLDFDRLNGWFAPLRGSSGPSAETGWTIDARGRFQQARFREIELEHVSLRLEKRPVSLRISELRARGMGGSMEAELDLAIPAAGDPSGPASFDFRWTTESMDIEKLLRSFGARYMISGTGRTQGRLKGPLDLPRWRDTAGRIDIEAKDGTIWNAPALTKVLSNLSVTSVLRKAGKKAEPGLPFHSVRASIELGGGKAVIRDPALLENPTLKLVYIGSYNLIDETIEGKFVIHFLTVMDEVIRAVPGVRRILLGKRMGLVPIWVEVRGPRQDPKVTVLPARSITDALWKPVENLFKLPLDLIPPKKPDRGPERK